MKLIIKNKGNPTITEEDRTILKEMDHEHKKQKSILEIGTGNSRLTYWLAYQGYNVIGIEPDSWFRKLGNGLMEKFRMEHCKIIDGDIHKINFSTNSFDIVICSEVIEHISNPQLAVNELIRCAKKLCIITTPVGKSFFSPDHKNFFYDEDIEKLFVNYNRKIKKFYPKPEDKGKNHQKYLILVEK